jgi:hypothetical protein
MRNLSWTPILARALAAFFVVASAVNILFPTLVAAEYQRWGYPDWFHFVTGSLEIATAVLLFRTETRALGAALGCVVVFAAATTLIVHHEYPHAALPIAVLALAVIVGGSSLRTRGSISE